MPPLKRERKLWSARVVMPERMVRLYAVFAPTEREAADHILPMHPEALCVLVQPMADDGGSIAIARAVAPTRYTAERLEVAANASEMFTHPSGPPVSGKGLGRLQRQELKRLVTDGYWSPPAGGSRQLIRLRVECFDSLCARGLAWKDAAGDYRATDAGHKVAKTLDI